MLGSQSLWVDEVVTFLSSNGSFGWVISQSEVNSNIPPLYYLIVHFFLKFGQDEALLRLPSLIFGVLTIPALYAVADEWLGARLAAIAALLMAASPFHIWYSQEARPYALLLLLALVSIWFAQRLAKHPGSPALTMGFIVSTAATFYCHTVAIPFIAFLGAHIGWTAPRGARRFWVLVFSAILVAVLPAAFRLIALPPDASADPNRGLNPIFLAYTVWTFATGYSLGPTLTELHQADRLAFVRHDLPLIAPVALLLGLVLAAGGLALRRYDASIQRALVMWLGFPIAFALAGAMLTPHPFNVRYVILAYPAFILVLAAGIRQLPNIPARAAVLAGLGLVSVISLGNYFFDPRYAREDNRAAGEFLMNRAAPGDLVIASAAYTVRGFEYYARGTDLCFVGYPAGAIEGTCPDDLQPGNAGLLESGKPDTDLARIVGSRHRFWVFLSRTYDNTSEAEVLDFAGRNFRPTSELTTANDIRLVLYEQTNA